MVGLTTQLYGQSTFEIYGFTYRYGPKSLEYFKNNNVVITNILTPKAIQDPLNPQNDTTISPATIEQYLLKTYPNPAASGLLVINWESSVFKNLRDYPVTDSRYKYAEGQWRALIHEVRKSRPRLRIGIYAIPFRMWGSYQLANFNLPGKYDNLLSLVDFIAPSIYMQFADEEVGHERNIQYIKDNLDAALIYGKRLNKPVYPFIWHRIHPLNTVYGSELLQINVLTSYVKFIANYSLNDYKSSGICMWESVGQSTNPTYLNGINNWLNGTVYDAATYDDLITRYVADIIREVR